MGTMKSALQSSVNVELELEPLKIRAAYFFSKVSVKCYFQCLRFSFTFLLQHLPRMPVENADLADSYLGIQFLPLDKLSFLKVQSLVNHIEQKFLCVNSTTVLYQDQVIW